MVTFFPSLIIFAFPMGAKYSLSKTFPGTSNDSLYIISFSKNTTGLGSLTALFNKALQSSASKGDNTTRPGTLLYQDEKS